MTIGNRIKQVRDGLGISQTEFAASLGRREQDIYRWESDRNAPNTDALIAIADKGGVTVDWLLRGDVTQPVEAE